jgi:hypothetical protein
MGFPREDGLKPDRKLPLRIWAMTTTGAAGEYAAVAAAEYYPAALAAFGIRPCRVGMRWRCSPWHPAPTWTAGCPRVGSKPCCDVPAGAECHRHRRHDPGRVEI